MASQQKAPCNIFGIYVSSLYEGEPNISFREPLHVSQEPAGINGFLKVCADARIEHAVSKVLLCLIEVLDYESLCGTLESLDGDEFPTSLLEYMRTTHAFADGKALTPEWRATSGFSIVENFIQATSTPIDLPGLTANHRLGQSRIKWTPLVVWTGGTTEIQRFTIPVIFVIGNWSSAAIGTFIRYCSELCSGYRNRFQRLIRCRE